MRLRPLAAIAIVVLGTTAVTVGTWAWYVSNKDHNRVQAQSNATQITATISETLAEYADQTLSTAALFSQPVLPSHAAFQSYVREVDVYEHYRALQGLGFVSWVGLSALPAFVAQARADGLPDFTVAPAGTRAVYCVASYVAESGVQAPIPLTGYDLCTIPTLSAQLALATSSGQEQVVLEDTLAPAPAYRGNFVLVSPVYSGHPTTVAARQAQLVGWVAALVDGHELLSALGPSEANTSLELFTAPTPDPRQLVVASPAGTKVSTPGALVEHFTEGGPWTLLVRPLAGAPGPGNPLVAPAVVFMMALLFNLAMAGFVWDLGRGRSRAVHSFVESERRFQFMASCTPVGILEMDGAGTTQYFNPRLQEIAGVDASFLETQGWLACVHPDDRAQVGSLARSVWRRRADVTASFRLLRPDGGVRHVRALASPVVTGSGSPDRYVVTLQDVTDEVAATEALAFQAMHDNLTGLANRALFLDQ